MASNLRVDTILPSTGTSLGIGTANGTTTITGTLNAASATITGNLGVGGVLTYEDVTNIDSVGVITARSGIKLGATGANTLISGNATGIGIGTDNPQKQLEVHGNADTCLRVVSSAGGVASLQLGDTADNIKGAITFKSNDNSLRIRGHNNDDRIIINSNGIVTKPSQAMFSASGTGSSWTTFSSGSGFYSLGDANIGGTNHNLDHGWTTTGRVGVGVRGVTSSGASIWENDKARFTAPVTGFYFFEINLYVRTFGGGKSMHVQPWVDSTDSQYYTSNIGVIRNSSDSTTGNTQQYPNSVLRSIVLQLTANQTFQWAVYAEGTNNFQTYQGYAHQSGYLIG